MRRDRAREIGRARTTQQHQAPSYCDRQSLPECHTQPPHHAAPKAAQTGCCAVLLSACSPRKTTAGEELVYGVVGDSDYAAGDSDYVIDESPTRSFQFARASTEYM